MRTLGLHRLLTLALGLALLTACVAADPSSPSRPLAPVPGATAEEEDTRPTLTRPLPPPTPTLGPPTATPVPPATLPPLPANLGPAPGVVLPPTPTAPPAGADEARAQVERVLSGQDRSDLLGLLRTAQGTGDEGQRYQTYVGAWQLMRDIYFQQGERPEHRALLDALEVPARTFARYRPSDFALDPHPSR